MISASTNAVILCTDNGAPVLTIFFNVSLFLFLSPSLFLPRPLSLSPPLSLSARNVSWPNQVCSHPIPVTVVWTAEVCSGRRWSNKALGHCSRESLRKSENALPRQIRRVRTRHSNAVLRCDNFIWLAQFLRAIVRRRPQTLVVAKR